MSSQGSPSNAIKRYKTTSKAAKVTSNNESTKSHWEGYQDNPIPSGYEDTEQAKLISHLCNHYYLSLRAAPDQPKTLISDIDAESMAASARYIKQRSSTIKELQDSQRKAQEWLDAAGLNSGSRLALSALEPEFDSRDKYIRKNPLRFRVWQWAHPWNDKLLASVLDVKGVASSTPSSSQERVLRPKPSVQVKRDPTSNSSFANQAVPPFSSGGPRAPSFPCDVQASDTMSSTQWGIPGPSAPMSMSRHVYAPTTMSTAPNVSTASFTSTNPTISNGSFRAFEENPRWTNLYADPDWQKCMKALAEEDTTSSSSAV